MCKCRYKLHGKRPEDTSWAELERGNLKQRGNDTEKNTKKTPLSWLNTAQSKEVVLVKLLRKDTVKIRPLGMGIR